ncbi:MAG: hypothetical protein JRI72_00130 [Deltaproteobacteria bacterium]|nr:hypothetical protein [Deltaproteobacteria bacterium]
MPYSKAEIQERALMRKDFMTQEEEIRIKDYISKLRNNQGSLSSIYDEYSEIEKYYENEQDEVVNMPNTKVNILNANIEGQVSMMAEQEMAIMTSGESSEDQEYAEDARIGLEWTFKKNYFKRPFKQFARRFIKFGVGDFTVQFNPDALNKFGLVEIYSLPLTQIFIDGKIKDPIRYQDGEYVAFAQWMSKTQFKDIYGEEKANAIIYGDKNFLDSNSIFTLDSSSEDDEAATLVKFWSRHEGKLRLEEFSGCGMLLYDSHKGDSRKSNQKESEYNHKPYYKYVDNKYPLFLASLYEREGNFWSFGDGKLILPLQKLINELYDKIRICARPNLILYDINAEIDLSDYDDNSLEPRPYDGTTGDKPVYVVEWGRINESWWRLLGSIQSEVQNITRFYNIMTGGGGDADSATESALQHQQGSLSTDDKKSIIQDTLIEMSTYILGIMIEKYTEGKSFRVGKNDNDYRWIDFREMRDIPVRKPATQNYIDNFKSKNSDKKAPKWEILTGDDGKALTKNIDLDIEITIGAGLPKNKAFITRFMQDISQLALIDKDGQPKPAVFWDEFRRFLKKFVGLPISDNELDNIMKRPMPQNPPNIPMSQPTGEMQPLQSAQGQGLTSNSRPTMSNLAKIRSGAGG